MKTLSVTPKNPQHFVALCFIELRHNPKLRDQHELMKKLGEKQDRALFVCAYGYFWVKKDHSVSLEFYASKDAALTA